MLFEALLTEFQWRLTEECKREGFLERGERLKLREIANRVQVDGGGERLLF